MANEPRDTAPKPGLGDGPAADIDMPAERRAAAMAHVAILSATAAKVAAQLPLGADVDDFRRVLVSEAKP
jgi:hypothetical protein